MSYLKTYGYVGKIEFSALFALGNTRFRFDFTGGSISTDGIRPASFTTKNQAYQMVIENSAEYKSGKIRLMNAIELEEDAPMELNVESHEKDGKKSYPDVTNAQGAREVLKSEYGATQGELQTVAAIRTFAEKAGVDFPNWQ